ncbi:MAG: bifunctional phosphoribosylaminoimidazolecarboxamide formyltransferase/IMP cyclohydrolase [Planctomycetota bacterium]
MPPKTSQHSKSNDPNNDPQTSGPRIRRALIAVADKSGLTDFAQQLAALDIEIISTGGTAQVLRDHNIPVREVQEITGFPEIMGGRVKTLHPLVHGGILGRRDVEEDQEAMREHDIHGIDLVVVNLYRFEETVRGGASFEDAIEQIDIGGPTMVRAAAKNHEHVAIVVNPERYEAISAELQAGSASLSGETRKALALEAFQRTAAYDAAISNWFGSQLHEQELPRVYTEQWQRIGELRYGENPHQRAAWYGREDGGDFSLGRAKVIEGKAISYNNLLDVSAAIECMRALQGPAAVIVKHCLPCGAAEADNLGTAFERALDGDRVSAFGGIAAFSEPLDPDTAARFATRDHFFEVVYAPCFEPGTEDVIRNGAKWGKNCRLIEGGEREAEVARPLEIRSVPGALLVQEWDRPMAATEQFEVVSKRKPTDAEWQDLLFAWRVVPFVRSNAILLAANRAVIGAGAGQPSRVDAVAIACRKAGERSRGAVLASDAFFPFPDGVEVAAEAGVRAVIQPGGSIRDDKVVEAADAADMALVVTGERHFKH